MTHSQAITDILAERGRHVHEIGSTTWCDLQTEGQLTRAAVIYAGIAVDAMEPPLSWPWTHMSWVAPPVRGILVKAAALIVAEIERLDRTGGSDE